MASGMSASSLQRQPLSHEYLISSRFQSFSSKREGGILWGFESDNEFEPITAGPVEGGRLESVGYATVA